MPKKLFSELTDKVQTRRIKAMLDATTRKDSGELKSFAPAPSEEKDFAEAEIRLAKEHAQMIAKAEAAKKKVKMC
jgi:hypothetical protein